MQNEQKTTIIILINKCYCSSNFLKIHLTENHVLKLDFIMFGFEKINNLQFIE